MTAWLAELASAVVAAVVILVAATALGAVSLRNWTREALVPGAAMVVSAGLGLGLLTLPLLLLGLLGWFTPLACVGLLGVAIAAGGRALVQLLGDLGKIQVRVDDNGTHDRWIRRGALLLSIIAAGTFMMRALVPPYKGDVLTYHLPTANLIVADGAIEYLPSYPYQLLSLHAELLYACGVILSNDQSVIMLSALFFLVFLAGLYQLARLFVDRATAWMAVLLFLSTFDFLKELVANGKPDLLTYSYALLAVLLYFAGRQRNVPALVVMSGLALGFSVWAKQTAVIVLMPLGLHFVWTIVRERGVIRWATFVGWVLAVGLVNLPIAALKTWWVGNPVAPFLLPWIDADRTGYGWLFYDSWPGTVMTPNAGWVELLAFPLFLTFWGTGRNGIDTVSPLYLVFLPLLWMWPGAAKRCQGLLVLATGMLLTWVAISDGFIWTRYLVMPFAILAIPAAGVAVGLLRSDRLFRVATAASVTATVVLGVYEYRWMALTVPLTFHEYAPGVSPSPSVQTNQWLAASVDSGARVCVLHRYLYGLPGRIMKNLLTGEERNRLSALDGQVAVTAGLREIGCDLVTIDGAFPYLYPPGASDSLATILPVKYRNGDIRVFSLHD